MKKEKLIIGTRKSELALWQANFVKKEIEKTNKNISVELKLVQTKGDKILNVALAEIGDKSLFTKELEIELLNGEIDLAVHSLKDLQTTLPDKLILGAVTKRHEVEDVLIARNKKTTLYNLRENAVVATGSLRRQSQLKHLRPDITVVNLRGNIPTRIQKFLDSDWDAIILARAGVERLKMQKYISMYLPKDIFLPAVGQGALGIEIREDNLRVRNVIKKLNDENTLCAVTAERTFLKTLEGGCQVPIGAYAEVRQSGLYLDGFVGSLDGSITFRKKIRGSKKDPEKSGKTLAKDILKAGAKKILQDIYKHK